MELLVCCVFAYWFVKHIPEIAGETAEAIAAAWTGQESPRLKARRERLEDAGIDPASGGAFGQFAGNLLRDFWLDQDKKRQERRNGRPNRTGPGGMFARVRDAFDSEVDRRSKAWRSRRMAAPERQEDQDGTSSGDARRPEAAQDPQPDTATEDNTTDDSADDFTPPQPAAPEDVGNRGPVRVPADVGAPVREPSPGTTAVLEKPQPALTERTPDMTQTLSPNGGAVTGMQSGAAEARAIARYLENATEAYEAAMAQARKRIHRLGEQTVGEVQMATKSDVVGATAQAAESIAAAQAGANLCKAETIPLMNLVARHFDRRVS